MSNLVKNLRNPDWVKEWFDQAGFQAANRIEELEANINIKADFIDATINQLEAAEQRGYANAMEAERKLHEDRIEELEAHLARYRALYEAARHDAQEAEAYAEALEAKLYDIGQDELKGQEHGN